MNLKVDREGIAKMASLYAGVAFGVYWIPLRALENAGFPGIWASVALNIVPLLAVLPFVCLRIRYLVRSGLKFHLGCLFLGLAFALYASSFLFTQVINAIVLYYLLPIWGFLLARMFIGEAITPVRWVSVLLGIAGIVVIMGQGNVIQIPITPGTLMALASGFVWASGSLLLLLDTRGTAFDCGLGFIVWGAVCATCLAVVATQQGWSLPPRTSVDYDLLVWLLPVSILIIIPAGFATVFGPMVLNPGVVGLLFMTEISVGTVSAAILTDEPFGATQVLGVLLVTLAGFLEILWQAIMCRRSALQPPAS